MAKMIGIPDETHSKLVALRDAKRVTLERYVTIAEILEDLVGDTDRKVKTESEKFQEGLANLGSQEFSLRQADEAYKSVGGINWQSWVALKLKAMAEEGTLLRIKTGRNVNYKVKS